MIEILPSKPPIKRIFHPTDFSSGSEAAFVHALKFAVQANALLEILHVDRHPENVSWEDFPQVRQTLSEWDLLPDWSLPEDAGRLGIGVHKYLLSGDSPVDAVVDHLSNHSPDLIVIATHHREGLDRWLHRDIAKRIARISHRDCLFVPHDITGFVRRQDGFAQLHRIVIPVALKPASQAAIAQAWELTRVLQCPEPIEATLLHVGNDDSVFDTLIIPDLEDWCWELIVERGDPASQILKCAQERHADLIALTTEGRHGFLDALRGSTSEQIIREASCPILTVLADHYHY